MASMAFLKGFVDCMFLKEFFNHPSCMGLAHIRLSSYCATALHLSLANNMCSKGAVSSAEEATPFFRSTAC